MYIWVRWRKIKIPKPGSFEYSLVSWIIVPIFTISLVIFLGLFFSRNVTGNKKCSQYCSQLGFSDSFYAPIHRASPDLCICLEENDIEKKVVEVDIKTGNIIKIKRFELKQ